jgi:hypothetical protein
MKYFYPLNSSKNVNPYFDVQMIIFSSLPILILNKNKNETRLEVRLPMTFVQQWTFNIASASVEYRIQCCPLLHNQFFFIFSNLSIKA